MLLDTTDLKIDILHPDAPGQKKLKNQDKNIELDFSYLDELSEKKENDISLFGELAKQKPRTQIGYKK